MIYGLVDFGSTFTKLALVDGGTGALLGTSQHPTTIDTDVFEGYDAALSAALESAGVSGVDRVLAASSAAGGLRMIAVGLVDDLTASAAKRAALSAGAKVEGVWSGTLGEDAARQIRAGAPDVILFAGGTDGGDRERVLHNARRLARAGTGSAVVVACNRDVADQVAAVFERSDHHTTVVDNVLPRIDVNPLRVLSARGATVVGGGSTGADDVLSRREAPDAVLTSIVGAAGTLAAGVDETAPPVSIRDPQDADVCALDSLAIVVDDMACDGPRKGEHDLDVIDPLRGLQYNLLGDVRQLALAIGGGDVSDSRRGNRVLECG